MIEQSLLSRRSDIAKDGAILSERRATSDNFATTWLSAELTSVELTITAFRRCWLSLVSVVLGLSVIFALTQIDDLLLDGASNYWSWTTVFLFTGIFWSIPIYRETRKTLASSPEFASSPSGFASRLGFWVPIVFGACPYLIFLVAILRACIRLEPTDALPEVAEAQSTLVTAASIATAFLGFYFVAVIRQQRERLDVPGRRYKRSIGLSFLVLLLVVLCFPEWFSEAFPRTMQLPLFLGAWIPTAAYLLERTQYRRSLFVIAFAVVFAGLWGMQDRFNDVRTLERLKPPERSKDTRQTDIQRAIVRWRAANGCMSPTPCSPAVLVSAEGGGSRAAFFASTVVGELLDATRENPAAYRDFANALFVVSGVSGGAVAAGSIRTALVEPTSNHEPPCKNPDLLWYGASDDRPKKTWRNCLQMLVSGDYLTPTFAGFAFRDWVPTPFHYDRSVLLERALERHYARIVGEDWSNCEQVEHGLCGRFGYASDSASLPWVPLLILGSTSVESGRPVLFTDLRRTNGSGVGKMFRGTPLFGPPDLFPDSYDIYELLASHRPGTVTFPPVPITESGVPPEIVIAPDVRIATAIVASARFPLMTPSGVLRNADGRVVTRLVDGGYYDNDGLNALRGIITELQIEGITPIVLHISNSPVPARPGLLQIPDSGGRYPVSIVEPPQGFWSRLWSLTTAPLLTLNNARAGHSLRSQRDVEEQLAVSGIRENYVRVMVKERPDFGGQHGLSCANPPMQPIQMTDVTLSWWLSPILQHFLDLQLCDRQNEEALNGLLARLRR
ncbi:hypothetical protein [Mesorhizobium sp. LSJC264A00]|uniref:hypothetical protein n=1 Tax=unclassified Mesorhizobium TaxID=325217 RepID=UPI0003CDF356|nr:hypothetical protein [Mesorhizobium sp. LSJC264A00]ESX24163.1 hypothetical protein X767_13135 [Mesorhizobium sp. LSJC264A00]